MTALGELRTALEEASAAIRAAGGNGHDGSGRSAGPRLERPRREGQGDYSTNAAMLLAPALSQPPREVAERLGAQLTRALGPALERFEVAGPGFLNLFLTDHWFRAAVADVLEERFASGGAAAPERVLVEFVSANPTGPMHVGHARNAAYGDSLARILAFHGHAVTREFYINDHGSQVTRLGESIQARARDQEVPEDGYRGGYVRELADRIPGAARRPVDELARAAVELMLERTRRSLHAFRVDFDEWSSERSLHQGDPDPVSRALELLERDGRTYVSEGALWLRTSAHGDDKDRVLRRSSGEHTYFASDIAYHLDKRERGFERLIDVWGADHHGYVDRMKAAFTALGGDPDRLEVVIMQFVHLVERGERASMSKRSGEFVSLDELVAEIGVDAARWYLLQRSHDTTIDLDLELARRESAENPVYYVQYAHARIASMLARAGEDRVAQALGELDAGDGLLHPSERALVKRLLSFPAEVAEAAERRAPHRVVAYALDLAQDFTAFYRDCRVLGAEPAPLESARIALSVAVKRTVARALGLLGVSAPESM